MLLVMPWVIFRWMSDDDLKAVYAYLRAAPPVNNVVPLDNKNDLPVGSSLPFAGRYDDGEVDRPLPKEDEGFTVRRGLAIAPRRNPRPLGGDRRETFGIGSYIANSMTHCNDCHTSPDRTPDFRKINFAAYLTGGTVFEVPPPFQMPLRQVRTMSANLTGATRGFFNEPNDSFQRFHDLIHTGSHVDEKPPRPLGFPMNLIAANLSKVLDEDLEAIYQYVKAVPSVAGPADKITQDYARWCASNPDCRTGESCFLGTHECVGRACGADLDCEVCQTCGGGACQAPAPSSPCVLTAH